MRLYEELETGAECERLAPTRRRARGRDRHERGAARAAAAPAQLPGLPRDGARPPRLAPAPRSRRSSPSGCWRRRGRSSSASAGRARSAEPAVELRPMERQQELEEAFRRLNQGEGRAAVAPSVAEGVGRLSTVRINARGWIETALQRLQSSDVALGVHAATTGGGGRITSIAALIGICVSGVGAGTYCVATVLLPDPKPAIRSEAKPASRSGRPVAATRHSVSGPQAFDQVLRQRSRQPGRAAGSGRHHAQANAAGIATGTSRFKATSSPSRHRKRPAARRTAPSHGQSNATATALSDGSFESGEPASKPSAGQAASSPTAQEANSHHDRRIELRCKAGAATVRRRRGRPVHSAPTALGAIYEVHACRLPDGSAAPAHGWSVTYGRSRRSTAPAAR